MTDCSVKVKQAIKRELRKYKRNQKGVLKRRYKNPREAFAGAFKSMAVSKNPRISSCIKRGKSKRFAKKGDGLMGDQTIESLSRSPTGDFGIPPKKNGGGRRLNRSRKMAGMEWQKGDSKYGCQCGSGRRDIYVGMRIQPPIVSKGFDRKLI